MAQISYSDSPTVNLGGSGTADDPITAALIPGGAVDAIKADADALQCLKDAIDVRATALEFSRFSGLATLTLSDGTELTTEIATPQPGTYAPNLNGNVIIPLSGGGNLVLTGLVSEPDVDISEFSVTDEGDGLFTVTPMLSNGDTLPPFSLGSDDRLNTLALGPDGCTLTGTLVSGIEASVPLCDLVPALEQEIDPATGSVTTTYTDPLTGVQTVWTIQPEVQFVDENGDVYDPAAPIKVAQNPITDIACVGGAQRVTYCDGSQFDHRPSFVRERVQSANSALIDITDQTQVDEIVATFPDLNIDFGSCPHTKQLEVFTGYFPQSQGSGSVNVGPEYSTDGGDTWTGLFTGGSESLRAVNTGQESNFTDTAEIGPFTGPQTIMVRVRVRSVINFSGVVRQTTGNVDVNWWETVCCPV